MRRTGGSGLFVRICFYLTYASVRGAAGLEMVLRMDLDRYAGAEREQLIVIEQTIARFA